MSHPSLQKKKELGTLARLAFPIALSHATQSSMHIVDAAIAGRAGAATLAATSYGSMLFFSVSALGIGLMVGMEPLYSQSFGAKAPARAKTYLHQSRWLALGAGLLLMLPMFVLPNLV